MTIQKPEWRVRGLGSRWQFGFFHGLIRLGGRRAAYLLSDLVTLYYVMTQKAIRTRSRPYLSRRFPERSTRVRLLDTFRLSRSFARILVDQAALRLPGMGGLRTTFAGRPALQALLAEGKGLVIVTAHVGAWQLGMRNLGGLGVPVGILIRNEEGDRTTPFPQSPDGEAPFLINPEGFLGGVPDMLDLLYRGGVVCIMGDRPLGGRGSTVMTEFLGSPAPIPYSPYKLASATGAPVAVVFPFKPQEDYYEMILADTFRVPPDLGSDPKAFLPYAARFTESLRTFVERFPYQFFNFYDMWASPVHSQRRKPVRSTESSCPPRTHSSSS